MALENCNVYFTSPKPFVKGQTFYSTGTKLAPDEHSQKVLFAFSPLEGKVVWRYPQIGNANSWAGTLSTAAGLLFFGDDAESFEAVDARTGHTLWHFNTGQTIVASPMSYMVNGKQYVAIAAGSDIFSFSLPH
jgi:alcohol dehydrogenase (cytochrome c)